MGRIVGALVLFAAGLLLAGEAKSVEPRTLVWDTGTRSGGANVELGKRDAWQPVAPGTWAAHAFKGDAVVENDKLQVVFATGGAGPLVYSRSGVGKEAKRGVLVPLTKKREACESIASFKLIGKTGDEATMEVTSRSKGGESARIAVSLGPVHGFVKVGPLENASALRLCARARLAAIPDFFGDDMVFDPRKSSGDRLYVPAENFLLGFTGDGNTILMSVWPPGDQEVEAILGGDKDERFLEATEVSLDNKNLFFAVLDGPGIWHGLELEQASFADKDIATGWKRPFEARWRGDFRLADRTDSWDFETARNTVEIRPYGKVVYPVWFEKDQAMVRLIKKDYLGTALVYPLDRKQNTPLTVLTPVDMLRETLGAGPCEYVLDREGLSPRNPGGDRQLVSTGVCNTTGATQHFFELGIECREGQLVRDLADDVLAFNITVRKRLEEYRAFARKLAELCSDEAKRNPAVEPVAQRVGRLEKRLDELFAERLKAMKTPEEGVELVRKVKELTREDDPENLGKYLHFAAQLRSLAGTQDSLAGAFRSEVRIFRRELGAMTSSDRPTAKFLEKLWDLSRNMLRKKHYTEGA